VGVALSCFEAEIFSLHSNSLIKQVLYILPVNPVLGMINVKPFLYSLTHGCNLTEAREAKVPGQQKCDLLCWTYPEPDT